MIADELDDRVSSLRRQIEALMKGDRWKEAAELSARAADEQTSDADLQRLASGCLSQAGEFDKARPYAARAVTFAPDHAEYAQHYGIILNACGEYAAAVTELTKAAVSLSHQPETYHQLAYAFAQLGNLPSAADMAVFASGLDPENEARKLAAVHSLSQASREEDAVALLRANPSRSRRTARVSRTLSGLLGQLARFDEALLEIDQAIALEPATAEFHLHLSWLLSQVQRWDDAIAAALHAVALEPESRSTRRHAVSLLVEGGAIDEAVRHGGALLALAPDEPEYLSCMAYLLDAKSMHGVARDFEDIAALKRRAPPRNLRPPMSFAEKLQTQRRSISALVLRDIRSRYGDSRLGFFWTLMEPLIHVGFLALVFEFTMHATRRWGPISSFFILPASCPTC